MSTLCNDESIPNLRLAAQTIFEYVVFHVLCDPDTFIQGSCWEGAAKQATENVSSRCIKVAQRSCFSKTVLKNWQVNKRTCCVSALKFSFQEARVSSKGLPRLGTLFSQILYLSVSWYNIPLIKFKVTLEITRSEKKTQKFTPQLVSE